MELRPGYFFAHAVSMNIGAGHSAEAPASGMRREKQTQLFSLRQCHELILKQGHDFDGKQLQRVQHLAVFDAAVVHEEDQVLHSRLSQPFDAVRHKLGVPKIATFSHMAS